MGLLYDKKLAKCTRSGNMPNLGMTEPINGIQLAKNDVKVAKLTYGTSIPTFLGSIKPVYDTRLAKCMHDVSVLSKGGQRRCFKWPKFTKCKQSSSSVECFGGIEPLYVIQLEGVHTEQR